ncbi:UNKNOWN [Stylonychia lemnae]|uniref:Mapeg family protein n=1 Tax=Stylonychia lemnae TaxID=5949 RepID=A0A078AB85_STYLE|nr:UNKNOWN [Stylonychia lemnae]|eukprot:CDW79555.1 UNKNOWN [Stylonychia lemnae]
MAFSCYIRLGSSRQYKFRFIISILAGIGFHLQMEQIKVRKETFGRNYAQLDQVLGKFHKEALGEDTSINVYGYPDIGNNIYADLLPYKDWIKINNAQRCHENLVQQMPIVFCNTFIGILSFPKFTLGLLYTYIFLRFFHIQGYLGFRGYNKAMAVEEFSKLLVIIMAVNGIVSSLSLLGVGGRFNLFRRFMPNSLRKP